jgi:DNA-directed RNA polymerase subunit M/transcription elongation factor TFIIS
MIRHGDHLATFGCVMRRCVLCGSRRVERSREDDRLFVTCHSCQGTFPIDNDSADDLGCEYSNPTSLPSRPVAWDLPHLPTITPSCPECGATTVRWLAFATKAKGEDTFECLSCDFVWTPGHTA